MFFERHIPHGPHWPHGPRMAFAWGGPFGPEGPEGPEGEAAWQPWVRDRGGQRWFGPPFGPPFGPGLGRMMRHFARRFPFGPGMPPVGPRMFGRGHLKYALLELLQERPKHGYEMIKELEEKSSGFYTPSAGAVYPTLQMLEDRDWVTSQTRDGKKVYTLTDAGRAALAEHKQHAESFGGPWGERWGEHGPFGGPGGPFGRAARPELRELRHEAMEVARLMRAAVLASGGDPERLNRLRGIVERAHGELDAYLGQARPEHPAPPHPPTPPDAPVSGSGPVEQV